jgi:meiotic recombination protein SPO11
MLERIVDGLLEGSERLTFTLKSRAGISRKQTNTKDGARTTSAPKLRHISFPGNTAQEAWNFS